MLRLEKIEKTVIYFLIGTLLAGLAITIYHRTHPASGLRIGRFDTESVRLERSVLSDYSQKININYAGVSELSKLSGVGPALAGRIVAYRSSHGNFSAIEDIKSVKGIGPALFEKIKDKITTE